MDIAFPLTIDGRGGTANAEYADHVRQMIEQLLFTRPGERLNRPDFGCGLLDLVFEPNSPELAAAVQVSAEGALMRWLGDVIAVQRLSVTAEECTLRIEIEYLLLATGQRRTDVIEGSAA
ncbi:GPW/gp25 family protein [Nocardia sp. CDC159]|uniref:GPW/gp25 family protein n=1 Tax=Nocardia pulmonis TaxID=2951408 RepID=A0A9X2EAF2_9NOCA|nr:MULTISPECIES: GPW/gp25 family protein [Nocardia]MCM6776631.1 GPW/gp25 family protein [Nocardia pulmonis]MCM6789220.1 GPW/gp25 family protein [Nocardia sp. CDC159]